MAIKVFLLGYPGSGKSAAYRHIQQCIKQHHPNWSTIRYNDYDILKEMFLREQSSSTYGKKNQFRKTKHSGFDVLDFTVLDTALKELENRVQQRYDPSKDELIIIEFARDDYIRALQQFSTSFLKDAYFLFIETDIQIAIQRIKNRVTDPPTPDNHYVSEDILNDYYGKGNPPLNSNADIHINIDKKRIQTIDSRGSLKSFNAKIEKYIRMVLARESPLLKLDEKISF